MTEQQHLTDQPMKYIGNAVAKASQPLVCAWNELLLAKSAVWKKGDFGDDNVVIDLTLNHTTDLTKIIAQLIPQPAGYGYIPNCPET